MMIKIGHYSEFLWFFMPEKLRNYKRNRLLYGMAAVLIFFTLLSGCGGKEPESGSPLSDSTKTIKNMLSPQSPKSGGRLEEGIKAYNNKDPEGAVKIFDSIPPTDPDYAQALSWRGRVCFDRGEFEKARDYYEKVVNIENNPQHYVNLGDVWIALFNWDKALENLNRAIEQDKTEPNWFFSRGIVYTHKKMYKEALADFDAAIKLDPKVDGYFEDRGYALMGLGRTREAMESFKKASELNPGNFSSYYAMGMAYSDEGEFKDALECFNKSLEIYKKQNLGYLDTNPKLRELLYAKIFFERGNVFDQMGRFQEAKSDMEEALRHSADSYKIDQNFGFAVHANYGAVLKKTGDKEKSLEYYKKALSFTLNRTSPDDWAEWGKACLETGRDKEALESLGKAVKMGGALPETHYYYGKALLKSGKKIEAEREFGKFLSADEGDKKLKQECRKILEGLKGKDN